MSFSVFGVATAAFAGSLIASPSTSFAAAIAVSFVLSFSASKSPFSF
jgi:hypothetical protein